jgi:hypothetical protein
VVDELNGRFIRCYKSLDVQSHIQAYEYKPKHI